MEFSRRLLIKSLIASAFLSSTHSAKANAIETKILKANRLKSGDTIGLIAPASNVWENDEINFAVEVLNSFGFKVKKGQHIYQRHGYLAGDAKARAADINTMFADKQVDGIFCLRGGYGSAQTLPYINFTLIKNNPKVFIGYSDITALLNAIFSKTNLITFHGPIARQNFSAYTLKNFKKVIFNPQVPFTLAEPPLSEKREGFAEQNNRLVVIQKGIAKGQLIGGNLSLMVKLIGTPYEPDYSHKILFLEDVEEEPYRIDGMLSHLNLAGRLTKLAGIAFGKCTDCNAAEAPSLSIEQVLKERLAHLNIPIISGLMIGHIENLATIPIGAMAQLDATNKTLTLLENPVL
jgi:muramoyltetrapeptide carboxypeptidase